MRQRQVGLHIVRIFIVSNLLDFMFCAISITVAVLYHPITILSRLWPYISLLITFGAFVLWNGGVVLGMVPINHGTASHLSFAIPRANCPLRRQSKPRRDNSSPTAPLSLALHCILLWPDPSSVGFLSYFIQCGLLFWFSQSQAYGSVHHCC